MHSIRFMDQLNRLASAARMDSEEVNANAIILRDLNTHPNILVSRQEQGVANGVLPGKFDEVRDDEGIHAFLLTRIVDETKPDLDVIKLGQSRLFGREMATGNRAIIPIDA